MKRSVAAFIGGDTFTDNTFTDKKSVDVGSIWGRFGVDLGSVWGRFWIDLRSIWHQCGVDLASFLGQVMGSIWLVWGNVGYLEQLCQEKYCQERYAHP